MRNYEFNSPYSVGKKTYHFLYHLSPFVPDYYAATSQRNIQHDLYYLIFCIIKKKLKTIEF